MPEHGTLTEAEDYFSTMRLNATAWDDSLYQEVALEQAALILEQQDYIAEPWSDAQVLKWKYAQFEVALWLLQTGGSGVAVSAGDVESLKIGNSVEVKYAAGSATTEVNDTSVDDTGLPVAAARFLKGLRLIPVLA